MCLTVRRISCCDVLTSKWQTMQAPCGGHWLFSLCIFFLFLSHKHHPNTIHSHITRTIAAHAEPSHRFTTEYFWPAQRSCVLKKQRRLFVSTFQPKTDYTEKTTYTLNNDDDVWHTICAVRDAYANKLKLILFGLQKSVPVEFIRSMRTTRVHQYMIWITNMKQCKQRLPVTTLVWLSAWSDLCTRFWFNATYIYHGEKLPIWISTQFDAKTNNMHHHRVCDLFAAHNYRDTL